jgi:ParB family chromosome partitioning protein
LAINQGHVTRVRELSRWIEQQVHLDLGAAPFPSDDAALVPEAGACTACPKRVGGNPALFADLASDEKKNNVCTDPSCYRRKIGADRPAVRGGYRERQAAREGVEAVLLRRRESARGRSRACAIRRDRKTQGALPEGLERHRRGGDRIGTRLEVCADPGCKTHFRKNGARAVERQPAKAAARNAKAGADRSLPAVMSNWSFRAHSIALGTLT